jgi:hypothetical protein
MKIYYRRMQGFPATNLIDVEVSFDSQVTTSHDGDWHEADEGNMLASSLGLDGSLTECILIADALTVYAAILDAAEKAADEIGGGIASWNDGDWASYSYFELDTGRPDDYEMLVDALAILSETDAMHQAISLASTAPANVRALMIDWLAGRDVALHCCSKCGKLVLAPAYDYDGVPVALGGKMNESETLWICLDCAED